MKPTFAITTAVTMLLAGAAAAQTRATAFPEFPRSKSKAAAIQWLLNETNLPLDKVTAISESAIFAIVEGPNSAPDGTGLKTLRMREEVLNEATAKTVGGRSALMIMQLDCAPRRLKLEALEIYEGSNLKGAMHRQKGGDWLAAPADSYLADVVAAGCDPGYRYPYSPAPVAAATKPQAPSGPASPPPKAAEATPSAASASLRPSVPAEPAAPAPAQPASAGAFRAQVGAFATSEIAWKELAKLATTYKSRMENRPQAVEPTSGAPQMHRAMVGGFGSLRDAEAFCAALRADRRPCLARR